MATPNQAAVSAALQELKFEPEGSDRPGAPQRLKITKGTVRLVQSLEGKSVEVDGSGRVTPT